MSVLKKLKKLIGKPQNSKPDTSQSDKPDNDKSADFDHLNPISQVLTHWITQNDWKYQHFEPDEHDDGTRLNVFVMSFGGGDFDWRLVIQVLEKPQLVTMFGILDDTIPKEYRLSAMVLLAERARFLHFGDIELDLSTGELRSKIYFDGEFTKLNERMLDIQTSQMYRLAEICDQIKTHCQALPTIKDLSELMNIAQEQREEFLAGVSGDTEVQGDDGQLFYAPSIKMQ